MKKYIGGKRKNKIKLGLETCELGIAKQTLLQK
jgi:hypothetical protein